MSSPFTDIKLVDNVFVKLYYFINTGDTVTTHAHVFDHITLLATGKVLMQHDNGEQEFVAPYLIVTPKNVTHKFTALEPNTMYCCIHAIREGSEVDNVASQNITPEEAFNLLTTYKI